MLVPVVEGLSGGSELNSCFTEGHADNHAELISSYLTHVIAGETVPSYRRRVAGKLSTSFKHATLSAIAQSTCSALPRLTSMISKPDMSFSDALVIQSVYLAIAPLFVNEPLVKKTKGKDGGLAGNEAGLSVLKTLRIEALGCLRGVRSGQELAIGLTRSDFRKVRRTEALDHRGSIELLGQGVRPEQRSNSISVASLGYEGS